MQTIKILIFTVFVASGLESAAQTNVVIGANTSTPNGVNVSVGYQANAFNPPPPATNPVYNTFIGGLAGFGFQSGAENTYIGYVSGNYSPASDNDKNTALGSGSFQASIGDANIGIGVNTASRITGSNNIYIGTGTGSNITGNSNVILGGYLNPGGSLNNTTVLGDGVGNTRVYIHSNGYTGIGIGFSIPQNRLEINATGAVSGTTGLRFRNFTNSNFNTSVTTRPKTMLSVNAAGDVILVDDMVGTGGGTGIANACTTANFITKSSGSSGNLTCTSIYDDGAGHVGFGFGATPNTAVNVSINGSSATYGGTYNVSDKKFKTDVKSIDNALSKILQLEGKTYNWKKSEYKNINFSDDLQYGLIAQDVQKVIPSLVLKSDNGDLAMNYIGLIPILIEALKDQQSQIEDLKSQLSDSFQKQNQDLIALENTKIISVSPNPSNELISVSMNIEKSVANAKLMVYDLKGAVLSSLNINERDNNITKTLQKDNFGKGVYIVSLVVNGKSIDSKKIIFN